MKKGHGVSYFFTELRSELESTCGIHQTDFSHTCTFPLLLLFRIKPGLSWGWFFL